MPSKRNLPRSSPDKQLPTLGKDQKLDIEKIRHPTESHFLLLVHIGDQ